jgi:hypothetical protein
MPRIKLTPMAKATLYFLEFYLIFLVVLILVKFIKTIGH